MKIILEALARISQDAQLSNSQSIPSTLTSAIKPMDKLKRSNSNSITRSLADELPSRQELDSQSKAGVAEIMNIQTSLKSVLGDILTIIES